MNFIDPLQEMSFVLPLFQVPTWKVSRVVTKRAGKKQGTQDKKNNSYGTRKKKNLGNKGTKNTTLDDKVMDGSW